MPDRRDCSILLRHSARPNVSRLATPSLGTADGEVMLHLLRCFRGDGSPSEARCCAVVGAPRKVPRGQTFGGCGCDLRQYAGHVVRPNLVLEQPFPRLCSTHHEAPDEAAEILHAAEHAVKTLGANVGAVKARFPSIGIDDCRAYRTYGGT